MTRAFLLFFAAAAFAQQEPAWRPLFDGQSLKGWKETGFTGHGTVKIEDGAIVLGKGYMTGVNIAGEFPKANYEVRMVFNWTLGRRTPQDLEVQSESLAARSKSEPADVASLRSHPSFAGKGT